jgi:serine phosphatase RsbU (regulator of sigma subunit)
MDQRDIEESDFNISRGIVEQVAREASPLLTSNAQLDQRFDTRASVKLYGLRSVLCVPIIQKGKTLGVIYVDNRFQNGIFTSEDLDLLSSIASSAGIAIDNARLYRIAVEKGRMERELQMAREVQISLIPTATPILDGWEFAACWKPAHEVSGDFYDFIPIAPEITGIVVADVSDKGMPAAMFMGLSRSIIRSVAGQNGRPDAEISKANRLIWRDSREGMFITLFYAKVHALSGEVAYVNAGHNPPLVLRAATKTFETLNRTGMAAGVDGDQIYQQGIVSLKTGDLLVMFTDGVTDAQIGDQVFGEERLREIIRAHADLNAQSLIDALEKEVCAFSDNGEPVDDVTLLIARKTG